MNLTGSKKSLITRWSNTNCMWFGWTISTISSTINRGANFTIRCNSTSRWFDWKRSISNRVTTSIRSISTILVSCSISVFFLSLLTYKNYIFNKQEWIKENDFLQVKSIVMKLKITKKERKWELSGNAINANIDWKNNTKVLWLILETWTIYQGIKWLIENVTHTKTFFFALVPSWS